MLTDNPPIKTIFMYSGQGSQYYQMGAELYASNPIFRRRMDELDRMVMDMFGFSLLTKLYASEQMKNIPFEDTILSSLAIFMLELAMTDLLIHYGIQPDGIVSLSMGGFAALCASGVADDEVMMRTLYRQAQAMEMYCVQGVMLAVLAPVDLWRDNEVLRLNSEIAAVNSESHFVLSFPLSALVQVKACLKSHRATFQQIPVSRAYHSRWIEPARQSVLDAFTGVIFRRRILPIYLCSAEPEKENISPLTMWNIARGPICMHDSIQDLESQGRYRYIDLGPSGTAATLLKHMLPTSSKSKSYHIISPFDKDDRALNTLLTNTI